MKDSYFHYQLPFLSSLGRSLTTLIEVLRKLSRRFPQYLQRGIPGTSRGEAPNTPITSLTKGDIRTFFPFLYLTLVPLIGLDHLYAETHSSTSPLHAVKVRAEVHTGHVLIRWAATDEVWERKQNSLYLYLVCLWQLSSCVWFMWKTKQPRKLNQLKSSLNSERELNDGRLM